MLAQPRPNRPCLRPILVSLAYLPPHFENYDALCRYIAERLQEPLPGETEATYHRRLALNRQNTCERSRSLFSAMTRLYQSCGLRDVTPGASNPGANSFHLHIGSEAITLEALSHAWVFLLDELVKNGALCAARKRFRGTQSQLLH